MDGAPPGGCRLHDPSEMTMKPSTVVARPSRVGVRMGAGIAAALAACCVASPALAETVQASGVGQATVRVSAPLTQLKIARAVEEARALAVPRAFINTQVQAARYAEAANLRLGAIVSVEEPPFNPFGGYFSGVSNGRFGPNKYCGKVTRVKRTNVNGVRRVVSRTTRKRCFKPEYVSVSIAVTFLATPVLPTP